MKILYNQTNGNIMAIAHHFSYGIFDEPDIEKWAEYDEENNFQNIFYLGRDLVSSDISAEIIPEDWGSGKYLFIDGEFVINPDWAPPEEPVEVRINRLEEALAELAEMMFGGEE